MAYVDDVVISCYPALFDFIWPLWIKVLSDHGLQVEPSKCKAWIPADTTKNLNIHSHVPVVLGGLPVLGSAAQSDHSCPITLPTSQVPSLVLLAGAHKRLQQAQTDADLLERMAQTPTEVPVRYAAWLMLTRSLSSRLDFDMRILPVTILTLAITAPSASLLRVARTILNLPALTDAMLAQAQLPGHHGGLFLTNPFIKLQVAHLASFAASWKHTFEWFQRRGLTETQAFTAIHTQQATDLLEDLHTSNIWVDAFGYPCAGQAPGPLLNFQQPLALEVKTLQGRLTNVLYDLQSKIGFGTGSVNGPFYKIGFSGDGSRHSVFFSSLEARVEKTKLQNLFF